MRIALSKGRIAESFIDNLVQKKIINEKPNIGRELVYKIGDIELLIARSSDIGKLLDSNYADIAVLGSDVITEKYEDKYIELLDLNTERCYFALAGLPGQDIKNMRRIASKFIKISKRDLELLKLECEIIKMDGSLELYSRIGFCDGIIDIVESGKTLEANGLVIYERFEDVSTRIVTTKEKENNPSLKRLVKKIK